MYAVQTLGPFRISGDSRGTGNAHPGRPPHRAQVGGRSRAKSAKSRTDSREPAIMPESVLSGQTASGELTGRNPESSQQERGAGPLAAPAPRCGRSRDPATVRTPLPCCRQRQHLARVPPLNGLVPRWLPAPRARAPRSLPFPCGRDGTPCLSRPGSDGRR